MPRPHIPSLYETALAYLAAGRSVIPIAPGCKSPSLVDSKTGRSTLISWERYQGEPATPVEVQRWFAEPQPMGLGIVAGHVSGVTLSDGTRAGLEFLDFDDGEVHDAFVARLAAQGALSLLRRLPCEETPTGGRHYGYLCVDCSGSVVLAQRRFGTAPKNRQTTITLIETRGQGGLCVVTPTPSGIHPGHPERGYTMVRGNWTEIPLITPEARQRLWTYARALDEVPRQAERPPRNTACLPAHRRRVRISPPTSRIPKQQKLVRAYALTNYPTVSKRGRGEQGLRQLVQHLEIALACAASLGLPIDHVGHAFLCVLPGHAEAHPSASLHWDPRTGLLQYRDWHARSGIAWYTLPDVRASLAYGQALRLRGPSVATWQLRLLVEAGLLEPYPVPARPLPLAAPPAARTVYEGFLLLLGCKWWHTPQAPTTFAWRFAAAWCGLEARHVGEAMRWLLAQGSLQQVGQYRGIALFLPG
jgi:hypothetical protein